MQISVCCSGNISGLDPICLFLFSQTTRVTIYVSDFVFIYADIINGFTAIPLLLNWESMLTCLLIKIILYLLPFGHKFSWNLFSRLTAPKIANFAEIIFAISPLVVNFVEFIFADQLLGFFFAKFAEFNFAI